MGRIKPLMVKRTASELLKQDIKFSNDFEENKRTLKGTMPSKKIRNKIAGYLSRLNKRSVKDGA